MESPDLPVEEESDRFQTIMAIMIAVVTLVGALIAWRAAVSDGNAGSADYAGLRAVLNAEETLTLNNTALHRHYRAYTSYVRDDALQGLIAQDPVISQTALLKHEYTEARDLATTNRFFFPTRYLNRDGTYAIERELGEAWAQAGQVMDLEPAPHFDEADVQRNKTSWLVAIFIALAVSLLCYTVAEGLHPVRKMARISFAVMASALLAFSLIAAAAIEILI